jgi:DNA mismatch repair ATPase MutS
VDESVVIIKDGRHPIQVQHQILLVEYLQELVVETFIPNDTFLSMEKNIGLITGANGSG